MKIYKILIVFLLLIFMVGAASAADTNMTDTKDIYVSVIGDDDLNTGSSTSPYLSIDMAISQVNDSDVATIHLSEGTFASEKDSDFDTRHGSAGFARLQEDEVLQVHHHTE